MARIAIGVAVLLLAGGCTAVQPGTLLDRNGRVIHRELLAQTQNKDKKVELYWTKPAGEGPHPALLFIHGHQEHIRNGGALYVSSGRLGDMASRGYVAASLSQPGYGNSDGPADYCGPYTQDAAHAAIAFLRAQRFVNADKIALYGYSRGAIVGAMVATQDPRLAAVVLGGGAYDFSSWYPTPLAGIDANLRREAGTSAEAFTARSALPLAGKIRAPVLLLHGALDERIPAAQARAFAERLAAAGVPVSLKIFPGAQHAIPLADQYREINPFLQALLR